MVTPIENKTRNIDIGSLYNGAREYEDLVRALNVFLMQDQITKEECTRFLLIERTMYDNEFAIAIATLMLNYSNIRANNLMKYYLG